MKTCVWQLTGINRKILSSETQDWQKMTSKKRKFIFYLPLVRYLKILSFSEVFIDTKGSISSNQWFHSCLVYFSGRNKVWQLPHFCIYNFLPNFNSERLDVDVSCLADGMYNADVQEIATANTTIYTTVIVFLEKI